MSRLNTFLIPLFVTGLALVATFGSGIYRALLYDREKILAGEVWRVLSGNLTHAGPGHWAVNMAGLWIIWLIYKSVVHNQKALLLILVSSALGTCLGLLIFEQDLHRYVGLSGALHGLLAGAILLSFRREPGIQLLLAIALLLKLAYEQLYGPLPGSEQTSRVPVIVNAHLYGALTGTIAGVIFLLIQRLPRKSP